jgi:glucuronate isomerase
MNVEVICTTDDPADSLEHHQKISKDNFEVKILPTFRPDKSFAIENTGVYKTYLEKLSIAAGVKITSFESLIQALSNRVDYFVKHGCKLADHGLERMYFPEDKTLNADTILKKAIQEITPTGPEVEFFKYCVLLALGKMYHAKGWTQQFHLGAIRNTNTRMLRQLGPDTGFDSIGDFKQCETLAGFLNKLDSTDQLAKTILYNLNPSDNEVMATMIGNYNDGSVKGKIQFGSAWWFLDQKDGMEKQINALSNLGLLSCFIGMLTDSRSFLSFPRHEYFRRILCNLIGRDVENGELPADEKWLGKIVSDICYNNAKAYFNF